MIQYQEHITKDNYKIKVWDGLIDYQQQSKIMNLLFKMPFGFALGYDTMVQEQQGKISCKSQIKEDWLKRHKFVPENHIGPIRFSDISHMWGLNLESSRPVQEELRDRLMVRAWINAGTTTDPHAYHVDSNHPGALVLLQYVNMQWDINWDGFTIFRSRDLKNIEYVSEFVPGRIVIFDADIPHKATTQSPNSPTFRFTINSMWATEEDYFKQVSQ
jgi:hypothetical protein